MSFVRLTESTLAQVCALVTDGTHDTPKTLSHGYPLIKAKEIVGGRIDFENCAFISEEEHLKVIARSKPEKGDTIFAHIGASLGEAAYVGTTREFSIKNVALFKPSPDVIIGRYLYYLTISPQFQKLAKSTRTGSAQPFLSLGHLRSHRIRYHEDIGQQKKITNVLSAYDDLIENNTCRIKILEEMAQRIYHEWFVNFRYPGYENHKLVDSGTELGMIPKDWEVGRLDAALILKRGFDLPKKHRRLGDVPVYAATGPIGFHNQAKVKGPGVVTGRSGSLGKVMYVAEDFWPLNTTLWVEKFKKSTPLFAYFLLSGLNFEQFNSGAAVPTLNRSDVHGLPVVLPPDGILALFDKHVVPITKLTKKLHQKNAMLRNTGNILLPKLIAGEIDVSQMDIDVGAEK